MPGINIITNFDLKAEFPLDSRLVASGSSARNAIQYKYDGMKVYDTSDRQSYIWDDAFSTWRVEYNGIYGGSGSLPGDVYVNFGTVSTTFGSSSNDFVYRAGSVSDDLYFKNEFLRHTTWTTGTPGWYGVEYRQQFLYKNSGTTYSSAYISFNPNISAGATRGGLAFGSGFGSAIERMRIDGSGFIGIRTTSPKGTLQIGDYRSSDYPLVIDAETLTNDVTIGYNWKRDTGYFNQNYQSQKIVFNSSGLTIATKQTGATTYKDAIFVSSDDLYLGYVGILNTSPTEALDVTGNIRGSRDLTVTGTVSSDRVVASSIVETARYKFSNSSNTYINILQPNELSITVNGNDIFRSNGNFVSLYKPTYVAENLHISYNAITNGRRLINGLNFIGTLGNTASGIFPYQGTASFTQMGVSIVNSIGNFKRESFRTSEEGTRIQMGIPLSAGFGAARDFTTAIDQAQIDTKDDMYQNHTNQLTPVAGANLLRSGRYIHSVTNGNSTQQWIRVGKVVMVTFRIARTGTSFLNLNTLTSSTPFTSINSLQGYFIATFNPANAPLSNPTTSIRGSITQFGATQNFRFTAQDSTTPASNAQCLVVEGSYTFTLP